MGVVDLVRVDRSTFVLDDEWLRVGCIRLIYLIFGSFTPFREQSHVVAAGTLL